MVANYELYGNLALRGLVRDPDQPGLTLVDELAFLTAVNRVCWGAEEAVRAGSTWRTLDACLNRLDRDGWPDPPDDAALTEVLVYARATRLVVDALPDLPAGPDAPPWLLVILEDDRGALAALRDALAERWPFRDPMERRVRVVETGSASAAIEAVRASREGACQRVIILADQRLELEARRGAEVLDELRGRHGTLHDRWLMSGRATAREVGEAFDRKSCSAFLPKTRTWSWMADRIWRCRMRAPISSALLLVADVHPDDAVGRRLARCADVMLRLTPEELEGAPASELHERGRAILRALQAARDEVLRAMPEGPLPVELAS
ncbi:MAG TPA: hypothetical protein PKA64_16205 [Myxococcota bacterium]|nr:hypothetical protein [Myxococcota bacterium]